MYQSFTIDLDAYLNNLLTEAESLKQNLLRFIKSINELNTPSEQQGRMKQHILDNAKKCSNNVQKILDIKKIHWSPSFNFKPTIVLSKRQEEYQLLLSSRTKLEAEIAAHAIEHNTSKSISNAYKQSRILREIKTTLGRWSQEKVLIIYANKKYEDNSPENAQDYFLEVTTNLEDQKIFRPRDRSYFGKGYTHLQIITKLDQASKEKHDAVYLTEFLEVFEHYDSKIPLTKKEIQRFSDYWVQNLDNQIHSTSCENEIYMRKHIIKTEIIDPEMKKFIFSNSKEFEIKRALKLLKNNEKPQSILFEEKNDNNDALKNKMPMQKEQKMLDDDIQKNQSPSSTCALLYFKKDSSRKDFYFDAINFSYKRTSHLPMKGIRIPSPSKMDFYKRSNFEFLFLVIRLKHDSQKKFNCKYLTECMQLDKENDQFVKLILSDEQVVRMSNFYWEKFIDIQIENQRQHEQELYTTLYGIETIINNRDIADLLQKEALIALENSNDEEDDEDILDPFEENNGDPFNEMDEEKDIIYNATTIDEITKTNIDKSGMTQHHFFTDPKQNRHVNNGNHGKIATLKAFKDRVPKLIEEYDPQLIKDQLYNEDKSSTTIIEVMNHLKKHMSADLYEKLDYIRCEPRRAERG